MMKNLVFLFFMLLSSTITFGQKSMGFLFENKYDETIVVKVLKNGPAAKAGLLSGDVLLSIDEISLIGLKMDETSKIFKDAKDVCALSLSRNGARNRLLLTKLDRATFLNVCISGNCKNGKGEFVDSYGNEYVGNFVNAQMNGDGKMNFVDGKVYDGNWVNNLQQDQGEMFFLNGDKIAGKWDKGEINGLVINNAKNGDIFTGIYKKNRFDGTVIHFIKSSNETYTEIYNDGVFVSSKKVETSTTTINNPNAVFVKENYTNGDKYEGYKVNGVKDGKGTFTFKNGNVFVGEFKKDVRNGFGKNIVLGAGTYEGNYTNDKRQGFGNEKMQNGDIYEGNFEDNVKQGFGKFTFKNGDFYEGNFANGNVNGFGKYDNGKKETYEGHWKDGLKDGLGKEFSKNGTIIEQNWANGKLNGKSTAQIFEKGVLEYSLIREYVEDKLVGNPKVIYANGDVYEGEWQFGTPYGLGQFTYKNGDVAKGNFWSGKRMGLLEIKSKKGKPITQFFSNDTLAGTYSNGKLIYLNGDIFEGVFKDGLQDGQGKLTTKTETFTGNWQKGYLQGRVKSVFKADGSITTYGYKDGKIVSESFNAKKFTTQIINLVDNINNEFDYIKITDDENTNQVNGKLNGFVACVVKYYAPNISSTGKDKWVYIAETELMTKMEALTLCAEIEDVFGKIKFNKPAQKEIEYDGATRRLINYSFQNRPPFINLDAGGDGTNWTIEIRINK